MRHVHHLIIIGNGLPPGALDDIQRTFTEARDRVDRALVEDPADIAQAIAEHIDAFVRRNEERPRTVPTATGLAMEAHHAWCRAAHEIDKNTKGVGWTSLSELQRSERVRAAELLMEKFEILYRAMPAKTAAEPADGSRQASMSIGDTAPSADAMRASNGQSSGIVGEVRPLLDIGMDSHNMAVELLAIDLHDAGRKAVQAGQTVNPTGRFIEWADLTAEAREGRRVQARELLGKYQMRRSV